MCAFVAWFSLLYAKTAAKAGQGFGYELRKAQYQKIQEFSFKNTDHFSTSSLVTRLTSDVTILQNAICNGIRPLVRAPFMMLTALTMAILINAKLAVVFLIAIPVLATCLIIIMSKSSSFIWENAKSFRLCQFDSSGKSNCDQSCKVIC